MPELLLSRGLLIFSAGLKQTHQGHRASLSPPSSSSLDLLRVYLLSCSLRWCPAGPFQCSPLLQTLPRDTTHVHPGSAASSLLPPTCSTKPRFPPVSWTAPLHILLLTLGMSIPSCSSPHRCPCACTAGILTLLTSSSLLLSLSISFQVGWLGAPQM